MLQIFISYNRKKANKRLAFNSEELYTKVMQDMDQAKIFIQQAPDTSEDK